MVKVICLWLMELATGGTQLTNEINFAIKYRADEETKNGVPNLPLVNYAWL